MKRIIPLFLLAASVLLSSCEGPMGPRGPQGEPGISSEWKVIFLDARESDWQRKAVDTDGSNAFYQVSFDIPELDKFIYDEGLVQCYIEYDAGTDNASQQLLPKVLHREDYDSENNQMLWTETIDYDYTVGNVNIYLTYSDFPGADIKPEGNMTFRLVLMW